MLQSPPAWEAGIEISKPLVGHNEEASPPAWEAGIEISGDAADTPAGSSPPAWGGGLKSIMVWQDLHAAPVAPRMGSVGCVV